MKNYFLHKIYDYYKLQKKFEGIEKKTVSNTNFLLLKHAPKNRLILSKYILQIFLIP